MTTQEFAVTGLTCDHCVAAVSEEVGALPGVHDVAVRLAVGAASTVTVTSAAPLERRALAAALDEAGDYRLVETP